MINSDVNYNKYLIWQNYIVIVYVMKGCERVDHLLNCLQKDGRHKKRFEFMSLISRDVVGHGGTVPIHPVGF